MHFISIHFLGGLKTMIQAIIITSLIMLLTIINKERLALKKQLYRATNKQAQRQQKEQQRQERQLLVTQQKEYNKLKLQGFNDELIHQIMSGKTHIDLTQGSKKEVVKYK